MLNKKTAGSYLRIIFFVLQVKVSIKEPDSNENDKADASRGKEASKASRFFLSIYMISLVYLICKIWKYLCKIKFFIEYHTYENVYDLTNFNLRHSCLNIFSYHEE